MISLFKKISGICLSKDEILIQPAKQADLLQLSEIHRTSFTHGWSDGEFEKMFSNENYSCLVAHPPMKNKTRPSGFVFVRSILDEAEIITIATSPHSRRKGIARNLMHAVIRKLEYDRMKKLFLEVDEANEAAVNLYKSLGFMQIGERKSYYSETNGESDKKSTALVMQLELG